MTVSTTLTMLSLVTLCASLAYADIDCVVEQSFTTVHSLDFCQSSAAIVRGGFQRCSIKEVERCEDDETGREFTRTRIYPYNNVCISPGTPQDAIEASCR